MRRWIVALFLVAWVVPSCGIGIGGGLWADALDVSDTKRFALAFLEDLGVPPEELQGIEAELAAIPDQLPIPKLGGFLSIPLGIGAVEVEGALLSDGVLRNFGLLPPGRIDLGEPDGPPLWLDLDLMAYRVAVGFHPRFDVGFFAAGVGAGLAFTGGHVELALSSPDPEVEPYIPELPPGAFRWRAAGPTLSADVEFGLPFLRLFVRGNLFLPLLRSAGEAGLQAGPYGASTGLVIRF